MSARRLVVAILAGALVTLGVYLAADLRGRAEESVDVVVAKRDLPARTILTPDAVQVATQPRRSVPAGTVSTISEAVGRATRDPVYSGGLIREQQLATRGSDLSASVLIPAGKPYAFNLPVRIFMSTPPRLQIHDRIDIVGYPRGQGIEKGGVLVADLEIIDIAPRFTDNVSDASNLTVAVTAEEIVRILAAQDGFSLGLALRPYGRSAEAR